MITLTPAAAQQSKRHGCGTAPERAPHSHHSTSAQRNRNGPMAHDATHDRDIDDSK
jgi:hypothetical protein